MAATDLVPDVATVLGTVPRKLFIGGRWVDALAGRSLPVIDPATGNVIVEVAEGGAEDVDRAVAAAREAFESGPWRRLKPAEREAIVRRVGELMQEHAEELALLECLDVGKPYTAALAADVPLAAGTFTWMAGWATKLYGTTVDISAPGEYHSYTMREPVGVVGQIIPWNFPLLMAAWKMAPALATGNTVVLKPAEETPLTALRLAALMEEAGVPAGVVNVVTGHGEAAGAALAAHPGVDKVSFTGSTEVGRLIVKAAAGNLKKVSLELGGKSPNIFFPDAELDGAVLGASLGIFYNAGQCCTAGSRVYVHKAVFDDIVGGMVDFARKLRIGPGIDPATEMGPVVSQTQLERVLGYVGAGIEQGAQIATGGGRVGDRGYFVEPTVVVNTRTGMRVVDEEIFGPVVVAEPFSDIDEVARLANDTRYGLAAGIWTKDLSVAHKLARRLRAGSVFVNCYQVADAALPQGGFKESGWGREPGMQALEQYTETKAVTIAL